MTASDSTDPLSTAKLSDEALSGESLRFLLDLDEALRSGSELSESISMSSLGKSATAAEELTSAALCLMELEAIFPRATAGSIYPIDSHSYPRQIGRFEITGVLGTGGFGIVYQGFDPQLNRPVAIKVPRQSFTTPELRKRFLREAHAAAKLDHPHIVPIYEAGEIDSLPYIAYAYCDGPTLARWCSQQAELMPTRQAIALLVSLSDAIVYSHSRGILHRDIKPSNVLLFPDANSSASAFPFVAKLSDLGLAKFIESNIDETASAMVLGTPTFMPPEHVSGGAGGAASDVYSLGATLYFLLTGRPPFVANNLPELLKQLSEHDPLEPTTLNPDVDAELNTICMKCLDKQPVRRYLTAQSLADDLRRYLAGVPIHARPVTRLYRIKRWAQRKPAVAALASSVCLLAIGLFATLLVYSLKLSTLSVQLKERNAALLATVGQLDASLKSAEEHRRAAEVSEQATRQLLYVDDVQTAGEAWNKDDYRNAAKILTRHSYNQSMREFTSRYLSTCLSSQAADSLQVGAQVWFTSLSHDGRRLAVGDAKGMIHMVELNARMTLQRNWDSGQREVNCLAFSPDDQLLASAGDDGRVGIWNSSSGEHLRWLEAFDGKPVFGVQFTSDGKHLVACGNTPELLVWECGKYELIHRTTTPHVRGIEALSLSPDDQCVATVGHDGYLRNYKLDGMELQWERRLEEKVVVVRHDPSGEFVLTGERGNLLIAWNAISGDKLAQYRTADPILAVHMNHHRDVCVTDAGGVIHLLSLEGTELRRKHIYVSGDDRLAALCFRSDCPAFITGGARGEIRQWNLDSGGPEVRVPSFNDGNECMHSDFALTADLRSVIRIHSRGIEQFDLLTGKRQCESKVNANLNSCYLAGDNQHLTLADKEGRVAIVGLINLQPKRDEPIDWQAVYPGSKADWLYTLRDGRYVIAANSNGDIRVRDMQNRRTIASFDNRGIFAVSPDERWLASGKGGTNELEIIDTQSWQTVVTRPAHTGSIWETEFSHDGQWLVTTSGDRTAKVWSATDWTTRYNLEGHSEPINYLAISPDDQTIVTGDETDRVIFWHAGSGQKLLEMQKPLDRLTYIDFTADGRRLVMGSHVGAIVVYQAE